MHFISSLNWTKVGLKVIMLNYCQKLFFMFELD